MHETRTTPPWAVESPEMYEDWLRRVRRHRGDVLNGAVVSAACVLLVLGVPAGVLAGYAWRAFRWAAGW